MAIKLEEHVVFIDRLQMDMVPLSIAQKAVEEAYTGVNSKVDEAMNLIQTSLNQLNINIPDLDDQNSTRES